MIVSLKTVMADSLAADFSPSDYILDQKWEGSI